jgi:hypothetical protein
MPLRDHLRPPISNRSSWQGFHGGWPMTIVQHLVTRRPAKSCASCAIETSPRRGSGRHGRFGVTFQLRAFAIATTGVVSRTVRGLLESVGRRLFV